jgi:hypothetical protein
MRFAPLLLAMLVACDGAGDGPDGEAAYFDAAALPGAYVGRFVCRNCPGIEVALWLRADGTFFLRQDYLGGEDAPTERVHKFGRWTFDTIDRTLALQSRGPDLRFAVDDDAVLTALTGPEEPQRLSRADELGPFHDLVRVEGEYAMKPEHFRECETGLTFALDDGPGRRELRRRHRDVSQPQTPAFVTLEARFSYRAEDAAEAEPTSSAERLSLNIEEVLSLKPRSECRPTTQN